MYESREASESRGISYQSYGYASESRESSESRSGVYGSYGESLESRVSSESCTPIIRGRELTFNSTHQTIVKKSDASIPAKYNNFDDIDTLIEQLEVTIPILEQLQSRGEKYSKSLQRRQQQIEKLRQLREDRLISEIEKESDAFEEKINEVKRLTKTPKKSKSSSSGYSGWSSESRDSGESRW